jgi:hypothetical protein
MFGIKTGAFYGQEARTARQVLFYEQEGAFYGQDGRRVKRW